MRVLVCGGRDYTNREELFHELHLLAEQHGWLTIIEGGARGADRLARQWAQACYHGVVTMNANWETYGRSAGYIRNKQMLVSGKPDLVVAFKGGDGTKNMIKQSKEAGVEVRIIGDWL